MSDCSSLESNNAVCRNGFVILGMHRSGTSALSGFLNILGFSAGKNLIPPNKFNERGYFEDIIIVKLHDTLLKILGRSWSDVRLLPARFFELIEVIEISEKLADKFLEEYDHNKFWTLKDPRICRLLPVWKQIFEKLHIHPCYLLTLRHPLEVASSLQKRNEISANHVFLLYSLYLLEAERETRGLQRVVVSYFDLLNDWRQVFQKIKDNLGAPLPEVDNVMSQQIDDFLSRDLQHHKLFNEKESTIVGNEPYDIAIQVYQLLSRPNPFIGQKVFDDLWGRFVHYLDHLNPWLDRAYGTQHQRDCMIEFLKKGGGYPNCEVERMLGHGAQSVIYWSSGAESLFSESKTIKQPLYYGPRETLRFVVPTEGKNISKIRWDIADRSVFCEIFQVWVEDTTKNLVWRWDQQMPLFSNVSVDLKTFRSSGKEKRLFVLSTGCDPFGQLLIPPEVTANMENGWVFVAVISVALPTMAFPILYDLLKKYETEKNTKKELGTKHGAAESKADYQIPSLNEGLEEILTSFRTTLAHRNSTILYQQRQHEQLSQELIRAEAQLDLLKEVILSKSDSDTF